MKKLALFLIFIIIILPILILGIFAADIYLTVTNFDVNQVDFDMASPTIGISPDNSTFDLETTISIFIPQNGFIPKAVTISYVLLQNTTELGTPSDITVELGQMIENNITQSIPLPQDSTDQINIGSQIQIILRSEATLSLFGFTIPYTFNLPDQTFFIP